MNAMKKVILILVSSMLLLMSMFGVLCLRNRWLRDIESVPKEKTTQKADVIRFDEDFNAFYEIEPFETALPILFVDTKGKAIRDYPSVMARLSILNAANDGTLHRSTEAPDLSLNIRIKVRGASSKSFDKQQYRVKFFSDDKGESELKYGLLGMGRESEWVLNGPFLDKTLARNYLAYTLGREIFAWAPDVRYFELFLNGRYQGVYVAIEPPTNGESRLRLSKFGLLGGDTAYIVNRDREGTDLDPLRNYGKTAGYTSNDLYVQYPSNGRITEVEYQWICEDISRFERDLYGDGSPNYEAVYEPYIDVGNFVDYYLFNELFMNHDAGLLSTFAYKELGGKLCLAIWDFNNSFDNYQWFKESFDEFYLLESPWFEKLLTDCKFVDRITSRYRELRQRAFSKEHIFEILDGTKNLLGEAIDRNFRVWGYTFRTNLLVGDERDINSYEEAVTQLKTAIEKRLAFLDEHMEDLYGRCR